jgi:hypothetical protein
VREGPALPAHLEVQMSDSSFAPSLRLRPRCVLGLAFATCLTLSATAQTPSTPSGFRASAVSLPKPAKGWSGLDLLPGGGIVSFDGQRIVEIAPGTGQIRQTLHTLSAPVFAADLTVGPSQQRLFYCESSHGGVHMLELGNLQSRQITTLGGCYELGFHPQEGERYLYVSALPGFTGDAKIFRVDIWSGQAKVVAQAPGYSGPFRFDAQGGLYFAPAPTSFGKPKLAKILYWDATQVRSAIQGAALDPSSARVFAEELDSVYDFVVDGEGTVYGADASFGYSSLFELRAAGGKGAHAGLVVSSGMTFSQLLFVPARTPFERFGAGGSILALSSDYSGRDELVTLSPARPQLSALPSSTPPANSQLSLQLQGAPVSKPLLWLIGSGLVPERALLPLGVRGLLFPQLAIVPTAPLLWAPGRSDAQGRATLLLSMPNASGLRFTVQALCGPVDPLPGGEAASPWVTSTPAQITVR